MASRKREIPDWKQFEQLVARIENDASPLGLGNHPKAAIDYHLKTGHRETA
jgi:hypothetical protein